ncbi:hypothetical protein U1839_15540 [Sphingomonas sp. RT2P30]|uniref:hypothetical protein n=1 Tax=Parasphingomonas halimpatiens TaxID=3096162 RepID=UPI002FCA8D4F
MPSLLLPLGVLLTTFWVSRGFLALLRRTGLNALQRLLLAHAASIVLLAAFLIYIKVNAIFSPIPYVPAQIAWLSFDWLREKYASPQPVTSRSRRRNSRKLPQIVIPEWVVLAALGAVTITHVTLGWLTYRYDVATYDNILIGDPLQNVIYAVGNPEMVRDSDTAPWVHAQGAPHSAQWLYTNPFMVVSFTPEQTAKNIVCSNVDKISHGACGPTLRVNIGDYQTAVFHKLGFPTSYLTTDSGKRIYSYPEIGHDFVLEQFSVRTIRVYATNGDELGWWWRFFLWLLP